MSDTRIAGYDLARTLAIFTMVLTNFKIVMGASQSGPSWLVWLATLPEGRGAATFVVLAGVGMSLLSRKARLAKDGVGIRKNRNTLLKRAVFLFAVGLAYSSIWPADILHFYGIYIVIGAFLLATPARRLWALTGAFTFAFVVLMLLFDYEAGWKWETLEYSDFWTAAGMIRHLFFNGFHPVVPWTAFLLIGMWLGRQDVSNSTVRKRILLVSAGVVCVSELVSYLLVHVFSASASGAEGEVSRFLFGTGIMPPMPLYMLSGGATALAVIMLSIILTERLAAARWLAPFVVTGQLSLTHYVAHVLIGMGVLQELGLLENQSLFFAVGSAGIFCAGAVTFSVLWRRRFSRGPLEWLMRKVTSLSKKVA